MLQCPRCGHRICTSCRIFSPLNFAVLAMAAALSACTPSATEVIMPVVPPGLKDCQFYNLKNGYGTNMTVVRCPNSSTTMQQKRGKTTEETAVVER